MALQYDNLDSTPTTDNQMSSLNSFITGPVWSGFEGASCLITDGSVPAGAIAVCVDVTRFEKPWYSYVTSASFTAAAGVSLIVANAVSPGRLVWSTDLGPASSVAAGRIYVRYHIELIEAEAASLNS